MYCCRGQMLNSLEWRQRHCLVGSSSFSPLQSEHKRLLRYSNLRYLSLSCPHSLSLTADRSWQCTSPPLIFKSLVPFYVIYFLLQFIFIPSISRTLPLHLLPPLPIIPPFSWHFPHSLSLFPSFSAFCFPIHLVLLSCLMRADPEHEAFHRVDAARLLLRQSWLA